MSPILLDIALPLNEWFEKSGFFGVKSRVLKKIFGGVACVIAYISSIERGYFGNYSKLKKPQDVFH